MTQSEQVPIHGWLIMDKPLAMTSTQLIGKVRWLVGVKKIGHAGTLDPLASGILPLALGEATKTVPYMMDARKTYQFTICWGEKRSTADAEGDVIATHPYIPSKSDIDAVIPAFIGSIEQTPPAYSAIKVNGKRAYSLARQGKEVVLPSRNVIIDALMLKSINVKKATASFEVVCSKGTYIRSLAEDIAEALGTLGYISALRRVKVGKFTEKHIISLEFLEQIVHNGRVKQYISSVGEALDDIPVLAISPSQAQTLRFGQLLDVSSFDQDVSKSPILQARCGEILVALVNVIDGKIKPKRVFNL